jgi:hypothetical protein
MITALAIMALGAVVLGARTRLCVDPLQGRGRPAGREDRGDPAADAVRPVRLPGCKPYAAAISAGEADINLCPPGGMDGVRKLADLLGREVKPLEAEEKPKQVAIIDEADLHRLHAVHPGLPGRCHRRRRQADAHHHRSRCAPVANCASSPVRSNASHAADRRESRQLEVEVPGDRDQACRLRPPQCCATVHGFKGGVKPPTNKAPSVQVPIGQAPLPSRLFVPLHQSIGGAPNPLVEAGDACSRGN